MSRSNELKKLIAGMLREICPLVYYEEADDKNLYPHIVFDIDALNLGNINRGDYIVNVDIWDKGKDTKRIEDMKDAVENAFNNSNMPQDTILPTFFVDGSRIVRDEDKTIRHRLVRVQAQNYVREE